MIWLRFMPYLLGLLSVVGAGYWAVESVREKVRQHYEPIIERLENDLKNEREAAKLNEDVINGYLAELEGLRRPPSTTPVRLCRNPMPNPPKPPESIASTTTVGGDVFTETRADFEPGPDIGPDLRSLVSACDAEIAKLRALQGWVNGLD